MHKYSAEIILPYNLQQVYDLVLDVEQYPEFLPWCSAARIIEKSDDEMTAELVIAFKAFCEKYTSRIILTPPDGKKACVAIEAISGPFLYLSNVWELTYCEKNITRVNFVLDFQFKSFLLNSVVGLVFSNAIEKMTAAFKDRALYLYGNVKDESRKVEKHR